MTLNKLILALLVFGGYTAYSFLPVSLTKGTIERAIEKVLEGSSHSATDVYIRTNILRVAATTSLELDAEHIQIARETHPGERVVTVDVHHPVTVRYLGSERSLQSSVNVRKVYRVDEAAEARRVAQEQRKAEEERRRQEASREYTARLNDAWSECTAKHGNNGCRLGYERAPAGYSGDIIKRY